MTTPPVPINRIKVIQFLRSRGSAGAMTEEIGDHLEVPNEVNPRRRLYHALIKMVEKKKLKRQLVGKRLWRFTLP